jgi:hypothetical protein
MSFNNKKRSINHQSLVFCFWSFYLMILIFDLKLITGQKSAGKTREEIESISSSSLIDKLVKLHQAIRNNSNHLIHNLSSQYSQNGKNSLQINFDLNLHPRIIESLYWLNLSIIEISVSKNTHFYDRNESSLSKTFHYNFTSNNNFTKNDTQNHLELSVSGQIGLSTSGGYVLCVKLVNNLNPDFFIFIPENMCQMFQLTNYQCSNSTVFCRNYNESDNMVHKFTYKPMFIVLMYALCASILIPIAIFQHFQGSVRSKRLEKRLRRINEETAAKTHNQQEKENLIPQRQPIDNGQQATATTTSNTLHPNMRQLTLRKRTSSITPSSICINFSRASTSTCSSIDEQDDDAIGAKHILNDKPWISRKKSTDTTATHKSANLATIMSSSSLKSESAAGEQVNKNENQAKVKHAHETNV